MTGLGIAATLPTGTRPHKPVLALTSEKRAPYIGFVKWRNQLLALFCLSVFLGFGVFYFRYWVIQTPFGIILFVGEGLDAQRLAAARVYAGGAGKPLKIDSLPYTAFLKNYSSNSSRPDAAAAATALATGVKVNNGSIGIDVEGNELPNLLELARDSGRMTGLVTNVQLTDATVASFYAHTRAKEHREDLARQLVEKDVDLVLGGGGADFVPEAKGGRRSDGRNLLSQLRETGYDLVGTLEELDAVPRWRRAKLFGLFSAGDLAFADENKTTIDQPTLADMVRRGIELLQFNPGGYLLVVDAGLMRKAAEQKHDKRTLDETIELDRAISVALDYAGAKSAVFLCGDVTGGPPIEQLQSAAAPSHQITAIAPPLSSTPETGVAGANTAEPQAPISSGDGALRDPALPDVLSGQASDDATLAAAQAAEDVVAFGAGLGADAVHGTLESTAVFDIIRDNL
ncbi:MAG: alkaline phosphatase [Chthoniobacterales bacterium]